MKTRLSEERAQHAVDFFEKLLVHTKGSYARDPFELAEFQREGIIRPLFGTQMYDPELEGWVRLYNLAWLEMARKNGKSEVMAGIALLLTGADDEEGAEVYGVARDVDQASLVFNVAKRMVELSPALSAAFKLYPTNRRIVYPKTDSYYRVIAADALGNLGQNPHGILFDEVIAQPNGALWDTLKTGFGARTQPLMVAATTAGDDPNSFAKAEHEFSARVAESPDLDPRRFVFIRSSPKDAPLEDEEALKAANPAYGIFLRPQILRDELTTAQNNSREERRFRQFRRNEWLDSPELAPIQLDDWLASAGMVVEADFKGKPCFGGLVAASAQDLAALCWTFPPKTGLDWHSIWRFLLPEDLFPALVERTQGKAEDWEKNGFLGLTEGDVVDVAAVAEQIRADCRLFDVKEVDFDPNGVIGIIQPLMAEKIVEFVAVTASQPGSALVDMQRLVLEGRYLHSANPVMVWQITNLMAKESAAGVLKIDRKASADNVFGVVAAELALRRALVDVEKRPATLVYW